MKKVLILGALGFIILVAGFFLGFLYIQHPSENPLLLIVAILLILAGLLLLYLAEQKNASSQANAIAAPLTDTSHATENIANIIEKNNQIVEEWNRTSEKRDKLKVIQASIESKKK